MEVSEILLAFLITSTITCTLACLKRIYKFKINSITCCFNCIKIERDVEIEENIENANNTNNNTNNNRGIPSLRSDNTSTSKTINLQVV